MNIISQVASSMQAVLTTVADVAGKASQFIKRTRKLTGATFVQTLVFGWLANPQATYTELSQAAATVGVEITPQALELRFTEQGAQTLKTVLDASIEQMIGQTPTALPLLERFNGVFVADSSWIQLPDELVDVWRGTGTTPDFGSHSSVKIHCRWELQSGGIEHLCLTDGVTNDKSDTVGFSPLPPGSLRLADLGYFSLETLKADDTNGRFWLTRLLTTCVVFDENSNRIQLDKWLASQPSHEIDASVVLGVDARLKARLLAMRVSETEANKRRRHIRKQAQKKGRSPSQSRLKFADYNLYITNVDAQKLSVKEAIVLARVRWQIELLFKLWKSHGQIDKSRSQKPWRILCEVYAKLIAMILQHWILLASGINCPYQSLTKASKAVKNHAFHIASAMAKGEIKPLVEALKIVADCVAVGCQIYKRKQQPTTFQLLSSVAEIP